MLAYVFYNVTIKKKEKKFNINNNMIINIRIVYLKKLIIIWQ